MPAAYVSSVSLNKNEPLDPATFPGCLAFTHNLQLEFSSPVTFFVGENGSGKSTLLEAMAVVAGLPICGGSTNETSGNHAFAEQSLLASSLRVDFRRQPRDRYFFRAETQAHFASLLEQRRNDPHFLDDSGNPADPFQHYGGRTLHGMSHGEAFLSVMKNRFDRGLFLMDEPESALSPQRQLALLVLMHDLVQNGQSQYFIATHSPILLTFPGATILTFDHGPLQPIALEETKHFQITRDLLNNPQMYWRHLAGEKQ